MICLYGVEYNYKTMLSRKYRAGRSDIEDTIKTGATLSGMFLYGKVSRKIGARPGFAIVISKKIEKTSVGRHRLKRKISAAIEKSLLKINQDFNKTLVIFPKKSEKPLPYSKIAKDIIEILKKSGA